MKDTLYFVQLVSALSGFTFMLLGEINLAELSFIAILFGQIAGHFK